MPAYILKNSTLTFDAVQEYFSHLNPLAQRIASDINATKSTYGQLWHTLNPNEQANIINETLIKPEISLKYFDYFSTSSTSLSSTKSSTSLSSSSCASALSADGASNLQTESVVKKQFCLSTAAPLQPPPQVGCGCRGLKPPSSPPPPPPINAIKAAALASVTPTTITTATTMSPAQLAVASTRPTKVRISKNAKCSNDMRNFYAYDGRNLPTYAAQKVALKIIYDDILGSYRDEHSRPFSYRTKSQINLLQQQLNSTTLGDEEICLLYNEQLQPYARPERLVQNNYKKLQKELRKNLNNQLEKMRNENDVSGNTSVAGDTAKYEQFDNTAKIKTTTTTTLLNHNTNNNSSSNRIQQTLTPEEKINSNTVSQLNGRHSNLIEMYRAIEPDPQLNYAVYTDAYYEHGERSILMHGYRNNSSSGLLTVSSSAATSDDDHHSYDYNDEDDDEKTLCEGVKLLDNDSLRKGFEFLNNW